MDTLNLVLTKRSSLEFLDLHANQLHLSHDTRRTHGEVEALDSFGLDAAGMKRLAKLGIPQPTEVLVPSVRGKRHPPGITLCGNRGRLSCDDVIMVSEGVYVLRPEPALARMAAGMSAPRAAVLIDQALSSYRVLRQPAFESYLKAFPGKHIHGLKRSDGTYKAVTMYGLGPLTSLDRLKQYVAGHAGAYGTGSLRRALPLCSENLRSPLEAEDYLLITLPSRMGGANLPPPEVNVEVALTAKARGIIDVAALKPDFLWREQRVVVEILGKADHEGDVGIADTSLRERVWREMGFTVITHTAREIERADLFGPAASELAKRLGRRYRTDVPHFAERQAWLRGEVVIGGGVERPSVLTYGRFLENGSADEEDMGWLAVIEP